MELDLAGKVAIVTGGSAGIGLACARALYAEGVSVVIASRSAERLAGAETAIRNQPKTVGVPEVVAVQADLAKAEDISRVVAAALDRFGKIDILINNAGAAQAGAFLEMPEEAFLNAWNLKLTGYIRFVRAVASYMIERKDGRIVNIVGSASRTPAPTFLAGSTTNAALVNFTRGISKEFARHNVRINCISPGATDTERADRLAEQTAAARGITVAEAKAESAKSVPLGHLVDPAEIAAMACFLVSDKARSITGIEIMIDGGFTPGV